MRDLDKYIGLRKGVLEIIGFSEEEKEKVNNKHVIAQCKCSKCGSIVETYLDRFTMKAQYAQFYCKNCKEQYLIEQYNEKLIGKTFGVLTVNSFNSLQGRRKYYNCTCNRCGNTSIVRGDHLYNSNPQSCTHCYYSLLGTKTKERYQKQRGLIGEEYEIDKKARNTLLKFKNGASARNFEFSISDNDAIKLLMEPCYYCGESISYGLDRIDSTKGYTYDNVVPCCGICNIMKNKFPLNTFMDKVNKIYLKHHNESSTTIENTSNKDGSK